MKREVSLKLILPSILCALIIILFKVKLDYYPIFFGLIIGIINWGKTKYNPFLGVLLSLLASLVIFFVSYFSIPVFL